MTNREKRLAKMQNRQTQEQKIGFKVAYDIPKDVPRYQVKEGENRIDIIMYRITNPLNPAVTVNGLEVGELDYYQQLEVHKNIGVNNNQYLCAKRMFGRPCPICEAQSELYEQNDREAAKKLFPQTRAIYNVIDLDDPEKGIQIWDVSHHWVEGELRKLAAMKSKKGPAILFGDFEVGKTIVFYGMEETFNGKKFYKPANFTFEDREPYDESVCDKAYALDKFYVIPNYEEVQADYLQIDTGMTDTNVEDDVDEPLTDNRSFDQMAKDDAEFFEANDVEDIIPPPAEEPPKKERRRRPVAEETQCPFDFKFGVDFDSKQKCTECPDAVYEKCGEKFDSLQS
jgi:hypothetical protein